MLSHSSTLRLNSTSQPLTGRLRLLANFPVLRGPSLPSDPWKKKRARGVTSRPRTFLQLRWMEAGDEPLLLSRVVLPSLLTEIWWSLSSGLWDSCRPLAPSWSSWYWWRWWLPCSNLRFEAILVEVGNGIFDHICSWPRTWVKSKMRLIQGENWRTEFAFFYVQTHVENRLFFHTFVRCIFIVIAGYYCWIFYICTQLLCKISKRK